MSKQNINIMKSGFFLCDKSLSLTFEGRWIFFGEYSGYNHHDIY